MLDALASVFGLIAIGFYFWAGDQSTLLWITVCVLVLHTYLIGVKSNYASDAMRRRGSNPDDNYSRFTIADELQIPLMVRAISNALAIILALLLIGGFVYFWKMGLLSWILGGMVWLLIELAFRARRKRIRLYKMGMPVDSDRN